MWLVVACVFGILLVDVVSVMAATYWEDDKELAHQFMVVCWWSIAAAIVFIGALIVL